MDVRHEVMEIAQPLVEDLGFELVDVEFVQSGRWTLRVYLDRLESQGAVSIEDCQRVSRRLEDALEMNQTVPHRFVLEVSSPGIERRLRTGEHFRRHVGEKVFVQTYELIDGRRRVTGTIVGADEVALQVDTDEGPRWTAPLAAVQKAHLVVDPWARIRAQNGRPNAAGKRAARDADPGETE